MKTLMDLEHFSFLTFLRYGIFNFLFIFGDSSLYRPNNPLKFLKSGPSSSQSFFTCKFKANSLFKLLYIDSFPQYFIVSSGARLPLHCISLRSTLSDGRHTILVYQ